MMIDYGIRVYLVNGLYIAVNELGSYYMSASLDNIIEIKHVLCDFSSNVAKDLDKVLNGAIEIDEIKNPELFL